MDPRGEERPVHADQASRERDREQEDRRGCVRDEVPRLATDLLRIPRQILGGSGYHQDQGTMATDEGAGENGDVHVRRKGAGDSRRNFLYHFLPLPLLVSSIFLMVSSFAQVRTLGPEAAVKSQPSNLSIEVWRLMESVRKNDCEADRSDDSSQDNENPTNRTVIHAILDKLTLPTPETSGWAFGRGFRATPRYFRNYRYMQNYRDDYLGQGHEIKIEVNSDTEDENSRGELSQKLSDDSFLAQNKRSRIATEDEPVDLVEQKTTCPDSVSTSRIDDGTRCLFFLFFLILYAQNTANE